MSSRIYLVRWNTLPFKLEECRERHTPSCWGKSKIPETLLVASQATQSSALLQLPNELLLHILKHARLFGDLVLILTCKRMFVLSSMMVIRISSVARHRAVPDLNCAGMLRLLSHGATHNALALGPFLRLLPVTAKETSMLGECVKEICGGILFRDSEGLRSCC
ncbi:hypothetical protein PG989_000134 [Apiospora arundinis]